MKFLADIPIGRATLQHLKLQGHDAISVRDRLPPTSPDPDIIRLAAAEERIILCFDLGMAELVALSGQVLPSVITLRTSRHGVEFVNQRLDSIIPEIASELLRGVLATVEDHRVRVRSLPIPAGHKK